MLYYSSLVLFLALGHRAVAQGLPIVQLDNATFTGGVASSGVSRFLGIPYAIRACDV